MRIKSVKIPSLIYRVTLLVAFVLLTSVRVYGQFVSNAVVGNYENASSWNGNQPPGTGNDYRTLTVVEGAIITKSSDFTGQATVTVNGTFNVIGNITTGYGGIIIGSGGKVEIFGDLNMVTTITVNYGGVLIVHGSFNGESNYGMNLSGNIIVAQDFKVSNGTLSSNGKLVVGGTFTFNGGGFNSPDGNSNLYLLDPDADHTYAYSTIENKTGDLDGFLENESDNEDLMNITEEVIPDLFSPLAESTVVFTSSGTFIVPDGVTTIMVEVWGGGGRGSTRTSNGAGAGGGGGAYSRSILSVVPGQSYTVTVGTGSTSVAAGRDSWFGSTSTILAKGGNSAGDNSNNSATGGSALSGVGDVRYNGGNSATGTNNNYGGGGGSSGQILILTVLLVEL